MRDDPTAGSDQSDGAERRATSELGTPRGAGQVELSDRLFFTLLLVLGATYVLLVISMLAADVAYMVSESALAARRSPDPWAAALHENPIVRELADPQTQYAIRLSLISCTLSAVLSVLVAVPIGYLLARRQFWGQRLLDAILDIPIVLPPLVVGLSLLILFQFPPFSWLAPGVVYQVPAVILAQFSVAAAFAVRTMKATFDHIDPRCEQVALTLGCTQSEAFAWVVLPQARRGMLTAFTLAWARSLGEFGPLLMFAGATSFKTEVLSVTVFLKFNVGELGSAVAVSMIMVLGAVVVLIVARLFGSRDVAL